MKSIYISKFNIKSIQIDPDNNKCTINIDNHDDIKSFTFNIDSIEKSKIKREELRKEVFTEFKD